ncbi:MAG: protein kinase [Gemmatimonadales bacterium]|jgi:tetratricopeptide (TPR) repeat protein/tRNA A-37 threonylcarbamoyl transferase component Bud32
MSAIIAQLSAALSDRYRIERELGAGGMATVYLAEDLKHQRKVAVKVLRPELSAAIGHERFLREITTTANLRHPHILPVYDSGEAGGHVFYIMPFAEGESLRERLEREKQLPLDDALRIAREVADALSYAHSRGVIHRDIKPENILLESGHAVVADFGIARAIDAARGDQLTKSGVAIGTPTYMSPEQAAGDRELDGRSDLYALGCVLYEMLAGQPPFAGPTIEALVRQHLLVEAPPVTNLRPAVPAGVAVALQRALAKAPADRFNPVAQFAEALQQGARAAPTAAQPVGRVPSWARAAAAAAVVVVAGGVWLSGVGRRSGEDAGRTGAPAGAAADVKRLFVMPLDNVTADSALAVWSVLAAEWIGNAIDRARPVPVVPATAVRDAIAALGDRVSVDSVAGRVMASYAVAGTLARTGSQLRFQLELLDTRTGDRLRALDPMTGPVDSVAALVAQLAGRTAAATLATLDPDTAPWLENASLPPSVEAYEQHLAQLDLFCRDRYAESIEAGNRALQLAPDWVEPLAWNRGAYINLGRYAIADSISTLLESMRGRMTTFERAADDWISGNVYSDPGLATRGADEMYRLTPTAGYWAAKPSLATGRATEAVERILATDISLPCIRNRRPRWLDLANAYHVLGRYDEELDVVRDGLGRFPGYRFLMDDEARAFAGLDQVERVDSVIRAMDALPPQPDDDPDLRLVHAALELRAHGHADAGARMIEKAIARFEARPPKEDRYDRARAYYWAGRWADAEPIFADLVQEEPDNWDYLGFYGATLARLGRVADAEAVSDTLGAMRLPWLRGRHMFGQVLIAAALGRNDEAIELLQRAFANYYPFGANLHIEPTFDALKHDPRWMALTTAR